MDPELNRLEKEFSLRLDHWISKQGMLFQMRHSSGSGSVIPKLFGLLFRLLLVLILGLVIFWFYLKNRPNSESFKGDLVEQIKVGASALNVEISSVSRHKGGLFEGELKINNLSLAESNDSFYEDWYTSETVDENVEENQKQLAIQIATIQPLGIGDGFLNGWSGKKITLEGLRCHLKTGAETDEGAMKAYLGLFKEYKELTVNNVIIDDAHISWGYDISKGSIKGANIEALKKNDVWELVVTGGTLSHGWLKDAEIKQMNFKCFKDGTVKVVSAELQMGNGRISFELDVQIKSKPVVKGTFTFEGVDVIDLVGKEYSTWVDGQVKGEGSIEGTLNSKRGVETKTMVKLDAPPIDQSDADSDRSSDQDIALEHSFLVIRGKFPILKAMQRINGENSYNLLRLNIGEFVIEQKAEVTTIKDINIRADNFLVINGLLNYAWSNLKENVESQIDPDQNLVDITENPDESSNELVVSEQATDRSAKVFSGDLKMGFVPEVFEKYPEILGSYPEDEDTIRVWIPVDMKGEINQASSQIAEELEQIVQEARAKKENN